MNKLKNKIIVNNNTIIKASDMAAGGKIQEALWEVAKEDGATRKCGRMDGPEGAVSTGSKDR